MKLDYKWVALSNATLGMLLATINSSILLIAHSCSQSLRA